MLIEKTALSFEYPTSLDALALLSLLDFCDELSFNFLYL